MPIWPKFAIGTRNQKILRAADALFTAFDNGWTLDKDVEYEEHWYAGTRGVTVYHFTLRRDDETMTMKVVTNPLVRRMLLEMDANVTEKKSPRVREGRKIDSWVASLLIGYFNTSIYSP